MIIASCPHRVTGSEAKPYDRTTNPAVMELHLNETFTGEIDGESPVRALQIQRDDRSASIVSVQRFSGKWGDRQQSDFGDSHPAC